MAATEISSYYAKFGFKIDNASVSALNRKITDVKNNISRQLNLNIRINRFTIGQRDLNRAIQRAVNESGGIRLPINSFSVNAVELRRSVQRAFNTGVTLRVNAIANNSSNRTASNASNNSYRGGTSSYLGRYGIGALAGVGAGYGLMGINQRSEDIQSSKVALNTITKGRGVDAFQWLKNTANAQGFDYTNQLPVFQSYMGASINKQGYDKSLQSFSDISQYGLTRGADRVGLERAMKAIGQMWSKGKITAKTLVALLVTVRVILL